MKPLLSLILFSVGLYIAYCGILFLMQRQMLFPRDMVALPEMPRQVPGMEKKWLATEDGNIEAWFLPPVFEDESGPAPALIYAHGNAEAIDLWPDELERLNWLKIGVLMVEYPGYGRSEGCPSQESITRAFVVAYDWLKQRPDVDPSRIILMGRSLGGGAVCQLAKQRPSAAMILISSFSSARSFAASYLFPGFLVRDPFDNLAVIREYPGPVLIFHGEYDGVIPVDHAEAMNEAASNSQLILYRCDHNDLPPDLDQFVDDIESFLYKNSIFKPNVAEIQRR